MRSRHRTPPFTNPSSPFPVEEAPTSSMERHPPFSMYWVQFNSVAQSCLTLCDPMDCSTPGLPVHHQLLAQTHVHQVGDAIQPSHPLSSPSPSIFPSIKIFSNESALRIRWPKYWSFLFRISLSNEYSGLISFRMDWFGFLAVQGTFFFFSVSENYRILFLFYF